MHRSPRGLAAIWLAWLAALASASAEEGRPTRLPAVEVDAHQQRQDANQKPRRGADRGARSKRTASPIPAPAVNAAAAASAAGESAAAPVASSSEKNVSGDEVNARPFSRPAEALEVVPGLIVTQHSGDGKANQYFLRGFNLDHGTDLAISVDDMPVNMRSHAHGQGYADLNFLIPELIGSVNIRKGPYFADEGDFSSVGSVHINLLDGIKSMASTTSGSFGYHRILGITSTKLGEGTLLVAGEAGTYNGPWDNPDDLRKLNAVVRYSQRTAQDGFSLTGMAYANKWNSTEQVPSRAIASGELGPYGAFDPSDGGNSDRFSLSGRWAQTDEGGFSKANFYLIKSSLNLWNDFTYFLTDPVNGDQFHQHDDRILGGINASHTFKGRFAGLPMETEIGVQSRYDDIRLDLDNTVRRQFLSPIRSDAVQEGSVGLFAQNTLHWTDWLQTNLGWRGDFYQTSVNSLFTPANSGNAGAFIGSPKFGVVLGPFARTEFFVNAGEGFHSNDARGVTITESPTDGSALQPSPFLVKTGGAEVGLRTKIIPKLDSSISLFLLDSASEILFSGDAGDTTASRPSRRYGIEWTNDYRPLSWLSLEGDLAMTHARFRGDDPGAGGAICVACRLSGRPDRQRTGQLHSGRAEPDRLGRDPIGREERLVLRAALSLFRTASAHRGQRPCLAGDGVIERAAWLSLRQWLARSARRLQYSRQPLGPDHLCLWLAVEIGRPVRDVLSRGRRADRAQLGLPGRRDGPRAASGRAAGGPPHYRGPILTPAKISLDSSNELGPVLN